MKTSIRFYNLGEAYGEFSNFAPYSIRLKGKKWPTVEHYFQAQKFAGTPHEQTIRKAKAPMKAAALGRSRKFKIRKNWDKMRDSIMYEALHAKFTQHQALKDLLLSTQAALLIEASPNDSYWGEGLDRKGTNRLGKILVRLRTTFQE
ncbi:MAG: NADAR family protein [Aureispira sp.]